MTTIAFWDTETNGLLKPKPSQTLATKMHCVGFKIGAQWYSCADQPGWAQRGTLDVLLPNGVVLEAVIHLSIVDGLKLLEEVDIRVAHNGIDFDERVTRKLYPWWEPKGSALDTMIMWQFLYPSIYQHGPNTHKCPGNLMMRYSLEAIGYRLGEKKNKAFDPGDWQTWSEDMQTYMLQDVVVLERAFKWAMFQKPSMAALETEHEFAKIMRRQEAWGFTFDYSKALSLQAKLQTTIATLEHDLITSFGEWWAPEQTVRVNKTRRVKVAGHPDVTMARVSPATGKPVKPYVGPPLCLYEEGAVYTPITRVQFNPNSRDHVRLMLKKNYGWVPTKRTKKGAEQVNDEVLRALPYPEAQAIADYFSAQKISGYVSTGRKAWLTSAQEEGSEYRMHGRVNSVAGTYTYRVSCTDPNAAQIPTRDEIFGPLCRDLFKSSLGFELGGWDGSGVQLRLLAHYLHTWDHGAYCKVFEDGLDPHEFMRDAIGTDLMGEGKPGRAKGKTTNYAMCFGGGEKRLGFIIDPYVPDARKVEIGRLVKARLVPTFGTAFDDLRAALRTRVEATHSLLGLDGRIGRPPSVHTGLSTLLQMGEAVVMKTAIVKFDKAMQAAGLLPGVNDCGDPRRSKADYEFVVHVYDEVQLDVRPKHLETYRKLASRALAETGRELGVKCPLKADVQVGPSWAHTH